MAKKPKSEKADNVFGEKNLGPDPDNVILEPGAAGIGELGPTGGVGVEEVVLEEALAMDDMERRELLVNPSDLQDIGDPESGDVGVVGGLAAGGEMGMSGGSELVPPLTHDPLGLGGTGTIEGEMTEFEDEKEEFETEKAD